MFENLLGQDNVVSQLRRDIGAGELPSSILLAGPAASGKLTASLELARILSCQALAGETAAWNCSCPACNRHRGLAHSDMLLLGPRSFPEEIPAARSLLERAPGRASAYFYIRAVRKLLKRFDGTLYEGEEARLSKAAPLLREIEERLDTIHPEKMSEGEAAAKAGVESARSTADAARKLEALVPDTTPVFQVRAIGYWVRLAAAGNRKTVIFENADRMLDASRNALLKVLEEPPSSVEFILVSTRRSALMATIMSRVRPYVFTTRSAEDEAAVLERIFKARPEEASVAAGMGPRRCNAIEAFLAAERAFPPAEARRVALSFLGAAAARRLLRRDLDPAIASMEALGEDLAFATSPEAAMELGDLALAEVARATKDFGQKDDAYADSFTAFLAALSGLLGEVLRLPGLGANGLILVDSWARLIRDARTQYHTLNRSPGLLSESLLYSMGESMRRFFERAIAKSAKMSEDQLRVLLAALSAENERPGTALDSMLDGIIVCDREHIPIIYNKTAERMLGLGLGFSTGGDSSERPLWLCLSDTELAEFFHETLVGEESVFDREFDIIASGRSRLIAASATPLVSQGRIEGTLIHLEDITEKRKREAQLRRAESLASLTTLAAGVAHEIKNPLGSISIHIQLIQKAAKGRKTIEVEGLSHHLGVVNEEIERLNKIVVDFLFAVRPMDVELRESDAGELVKELADFIRYEAENARVSVECRIAEKLPRVLLDKRYIKQAILNLAKNALAAMPDGGTLSFIVESRDEEVLISVEDSGTGISEEDLSKIFEPYYTTKETGTGLGLTITFKIVREHQGEITVKSKPGYGSVFTISLPVPQKDKRLLSWREPPGAAPALKAGPSMPLTDTRPPPEEKK